MFLSNSWAKSFAPPFAPYTTPPLSCVRISFNDSWARLLLSRAIGSVAIACAAICSFLSSLSILAKSNFCLSSTSLSNSLLTLCVIFPTVSESIPPVLISSPAAIKESATAASLDLFSTAFNNLDTHVSFLLPSSLNLFPFSVDGSMVSEPLCPTVLPFCPTSRSGFS